MSIQSEINRIAGAKSDIADAIEDKGVTVPSGTKLDGMANLIGQISGGSEKLNSTQAADAYDPTATYAVGDKVSYAGNVYSCISAISTPEAWDSTHWDQVDPIQDQVDDVRNTLNQLESEIGIVVDGKSCVLGASQGQYVILKNSTISGKSDGLYTAAQAIPAGEQNVTSAMLTGPISGGGLNSLKNSVDLANTHGRTSVYTGAGTYCDDIGTGLPLTYPIGDWGKSIYLELMLYEGSIAGGNRRTVILPVTNNGSLNASYFPYAYSNGIGVVRVEISNDTFTLISATASSLYVGAIYIHF